MIKIAFILLVIAVVHSKSQLEDKIFIDHALHDVGNFQREIKKKRNIPQFDKTVLQVSTVTPECATLMTNLKEDIKKKLFNQIEKLTDVENSIIGTSGMFPSSFGKYRSCQEDPAMKYYYGSFFITHPDGSYDYLCPTGVCLPKECNTADAYVIFNTSTFFPKLVPVNYVTNFKDI